MKILNFISSPSDIKKLSLDELSQLSQEIREFLIDNVTQTGGHLAPNLGVVELTLALHYVFETPKDNFIWDVGHQSYTHKILTGRKDLFPQLRKRNGLSGYPCPNESEHDTFHAGHSSTSVSLGAGIATAKKMSNNKSATLAIIGDGSFTSGMVYEALNDIAWRDIPLLVILNDNKMSISENVGGIAKHLDALRVNRNYRSLKKRFTKIIEKNQTMSWMLDFLYHIKSAFKSIFYRKENVFENLGINYLGPFNGHNLKQLIDLFEQIKNSTAPLLVHILTEKGKGHSESQSDPTNYHGISGKDDSIPILSKYGQSWSVIFGEIICDLAYENTEIVAITAAMREGTGLYHFAQKFPDRFIDVGIAEQHAITCAAGLALQGKRPVLAIYSTFLQRAYDQVIHDLCLAPLPVILCLDRSGLVPGDGKTHQGIFDIAFLRTIPNMVIMSPLTKKEFRMMMDFSLGLNQPVAIRYPKDVAPQEKYAFDPIELGKGQEILSGTDGVIVIFGSLLDQAQKLVEKFKTHHLLFSLYHIRFAKPIHKDVLNYLDRFSKIIILEDGIQQGGLGEFLKSKLYHKTILFNIDEQFPTVDTREGLIQEFFNLDEIVSKVVQNKIDQ